MKQKSELETIQEYINNFDPEEFSSTADWQKNIPDESRKLWQVNKFKARMQRKKQMDASFLRSLEQEMLADSDVTITQEQIDELLANM